MSIRFAAVLLCVSGVVYGQTPLPEAAAFQSLRFLQGTWKADGQGPGGVKSSGSYTFAPELDGHVLARHSRTAECKAPSTFDCQHGDLLYVYLDAHGQPLKAIYFDSEGHTLHYDVSTPTPTSVVFLSDAAQPGPQFRLTYELKGEVMAGRFQMHMPGQTEWRSYLEWSGARQ